MGCRSRVWDADRGCRTGDMGDRMQMKDARYEAQNMGCRSRI